MGKKKTIKTEEPDKKTFYGVSINGMLYYFDEYDRDAIQGLLLMKEVLEGKN